MRLIPWLLGLWVLVSLPLSAQTQEEIVGRIEQGLTPPVLIEGESAVRWNVAERMAFHHVPGLSAAVVRGGTIVWAKGYGVLEAGRPEQVSATTLFQAASISKPVASMGALRLVAQGIMKLDEDVNEKLKSWRVPADDFTKIEKVTSRRLLSHSAGLTVHGFRGYADGETLPSLIQILNGTRPANSAAVRVDVTPGSIWRYSGGGFTVMQQLMMDATGMEFPALMRNLVLEAIGMNRSTYEQPLPAASRARAGCGHRSDGRVVKGLWHTYPEMAAAGLWTTPTDLALFAIELREEARGCSSKVLTQEMARTMLTLQKQDYGLGVRIQGQGKSLRFSHGGGNEGYRCFLVMYEESGDGAVIMTNGDAGDQLFLEFLRSIATEYGWLDYRQERKKVVAVPTNTLKLYEGSYDLGGDKFRFKLEGDSLWLDLEWRPRVKLFPESESRFFAAEDNIPTVTFLRNETVVIDQIELMGRTGRRSQ